jgi:hypothetical protein
MTGAQRTASQPRQGAASNAPTGFSAWYWKRWSAGGGRAGLPARPSLRAIHPERRLASDAQVYSRVADNRHHDSRRRHDCPQPASRWRPLQHQRGNQTPEHHSLQRVATGEAVVGRGEAAQTGSQVVGRATRSLASWTMATPPTTASRGNGARRRWPRHQSTAPSASPTSDSTRASPRSVAASTGGDEASGGCQVGRAPGGRGRVSVQPRLERGACGPDGDAAYPRAWNRPNCPCRQRSGPRRSWAPCWLRVKLRTKDRQRERCCWDHGGLNSYACVSLSARAVAAATQRSMASTSPNRPSTRPTISREVIVGLHHLCTSR